MKRHAPRWPARGRLLAIGVSAVAAATGGGLAVQSATAAFPGDNGSIVFASNRSAADASTDFEIYSMRADATDVRQLTDNTTLPPSTESGGSGGSGGSGDTGGSTGATTGNGTGKTGGSAPMAIDDQQPAVSPNGKEIAFVSNRPAADGKTDDTEIYVMNIDGTHVRQITKNGSGGGGPGNDYEPAWSPDSKQIAYRHNEGRLADLYVVDVKTHQETKLVTAYDKGPAAYDAQPSWSPDGTKILFRKGTGKYADIWEYNLLDGDAATATRMLIHDPAVPESSPSWSPNGKQIVFESTRDGVLKKPETESGTEEGGGGGMSGGHEEETEAPLVGACELFVVNSDGSGLTRLTQATSVDGPQDVGPDWQTIPLPTQPAVPQQQLTAPVVEVPVVSSRGGNTVCLTRRVERIQVRVTARDRQHLWA